MQNLSFYPNIYHDIQPNRCRRMNALTKTDIIRYLNGNHKNLATMTKSIAAEALIKKEFSTDKND